MIVLPEQSLDSLTKKRVAGTSRFKKGGSVRRVLPF